MTAEKPAPLRYDPDGRPRCFWHGGHADYVAYHDNEAV